MYNFYMKVFAVRETEIQNISFVSIMTALTVGLFAVVNFIPLSFIGIALFFPLLSFIVGYLCKTRYHILYIMASIILSVTFCFFDLSNLLFYLIPALITGLSTSILAKKNVSIYIQIISSTISLLILSLLSLPIIKGLYEIDLINDILRLLNINKLNHIDSFILPSILLFCFMQSLLSYLFIYVVSYRLNINLVFESKHTKYLGIAAIFTSILTFIFGFIALPFGLPYTMFLLTIILMIFSALNLKFSTKLDIIILVISVALAFILYVALYNYVPAPNKILVLALSGSFYGLYFTLRKFVYLTNKEKEQQL